MWDLFRKMFAQVTFHNPQEMRHRQPFTLVFAFKQNNDKETNLTFRKSMHSMKNNEN